MTRKSGRAFQAPTDEDDVQTSGPVDAQTKAKPPEPTETKAEPTASRPEHRQGRKNLSVWVNEKAHRTLKALAAEEGVSLQDYVIEMLNREFARKGRPEIAQ